MRRASRLVLLWLLCPVPGPAQTLAYEGSLGVSTGRYLFDERTTSFGLSTGLALKTGRLTIRASLPVWLQNSTVISASPLGLPGSGVPSGPGSGGVPTGGSSSGTVGDSGKGRTGGGGSGSGGGGLSGGADEASLGAARRVEVPSTSFTDYQFAIGDPLASVSVSVMRGERASLSLTGLAKVPVTDTTGFGTGEWDAGLAIGSTLRLGPRSLLGLDAAWWYLGDMPGLDFRNPVSGTVSLNQLLRSGWGLVFFASGSSSALPGFDPPVTAGGGIVRLGEGHSWGIQGGAGLTETSPELSVALFWRTGL